MKRRYFAIAFVLLVICTQANSQDVVNFYHNLPLNVAAPTVNNNSITHPFIHNTNFTNSQTNYYDGEYEIYIKDLFWHPSWFDPITVVPTRMSFQYEVVSFPFAVGCGFTGGCGFNCPNGMNPPPPGYTHDRKLKLPAAPGVFDPNNLYWYYPQHNTFVPYLYLKTPMREFFGDFSSNGSNPGHVLISRAFSSTMLDYNGRAILPHSVIKVIINLHCGNFVSPSNIITSLQYVYDNTRGRMRFYPFYDDNCNGSNLARHDQIFRPQLLYNLSFKDYQTPPINNVILPGNGYLNYYEYSEIDDHGCTGTAPDDEYDFFYYIDPNTYDIEFMKFFPSPKTLLTSPLRQHKGALPAGYQLISGNLQLLSTNALLRHQYEIDQNIDLNIINPVEKVIYNPSETNITADNLIFPSYYTFKTIRGVYPSEADAVTDNTSGNGGPYTDLRDVPVTTDLSSENASDPANDPVYASRYYLKDGSKLTIQSCARLFDVTFDVEQGSTMIIEDYSQILGQEDKSNNPGRYKIRGLGGAVLRNTASVQYVQNSNITQSYPLYYTATNQIIAGEDVDTDQDAIIGDYVLQPGSEVTFHANHIIRLKPGFRAKSGSRFTAYCDNNVAQFPICISSNRFMSLGAIHENDPSPSGTPALQLYPNPTTGFLDFARENSEAQPGKVEVFDGRGKLILEQIYSVSPLPQLDLSQHPDGIYLVKVTQGSGSRSAKVVLNRE